MAWGRYNKSAALRVYCVRTLGSDSNMEPNAHQPERQPDERIAVLLNEYFERRHRGEELSPELFGAEHQELAAELRPYLDGLTLIDEARTHASQPQVTADVPSVAPMLKVAGYELLEEIGRGGMGVVYRALQVSTQRVVAFKVMLAGPFASPSARRRFEREVQLAARLQHPSIARVLESGTVEGQRYYAMDYVSGVRLDQYLARRRPAQDVVLALFERVCEAVD